MKRIRVPEIKAGIWLDQENAFVTLVQGKEEPVTTRLRSGVESRVRMKGEGKVFARFGSAFISDEEKKQNRQHNQREKFFKRIISTIKNADYIFLFGPGRAKLGLQNAIERVKGFKGKVAAIQPADKMTVDEAQAAVKDYFNGMAFKSYKQQVRYMRRRAGSM